VNYDAVGRPIESGEFVMTTGDAFESGELDNASILEDISPSGGLSGINGNATQQIFTYYDEAQNNIPGNREQRFVHGAISYSKKDNSITTWYSYDERGRGEWLVQDIVGLGVKTIDYRYGPTGQVQDVVYQKDAGNENKERFTHHYEYDGDGRLKKVYTTPEFLVYDRYGKLVNEGVTYRDNSEEILDPGPLELQATYHYYLHGPLKRIEYAKAKQGIDYVYTANGALKSINSASEVPGNDPGLDGDGENPAFQPDVFGLSIDYHASDYTGVNGRTDGAALTGGENQYSGLIRATRWHSPIESDKQFGYVYSYDPKNHFNQANWGTVDSGALAPDILQAYQEIVGSYDGNGNILRLNRNSSRNRLSSENDNISLANFQYHYRANSNTLDNITDGSETVRSYQYDDIGRLTAETIGESTKHIVYDVTGKVTGVYKDANHTIPVTTFKYDDRGFRLSKVTYNDEGTSVLTTTWYVRDASGNVMAVYVPNGNDDTKVLDVPVYAQGRIGSYKPDFGMTYYELVDHLGNVRAVIGEPLTVTHLATMETERSVDESDEGEFLNLIPSQTSSAINHTPSDVTIDQIPIHIDNPNEVNRLNNMPNGEAHPNPIGTGIILSVTPGDKVDLEVQVKYADFNAGNTNIVSGLAGFLATTFTQSAVIDGASIFNIVNDPGFTALPVWSKLSDDQPQAFLNYLLFDNNGKFVDYDFVQVTSVANVANASPHETLSLSNIQIKKPGFIYIYVSNLSNQDMEVYFDDLKVTHTYSRIVAGGDYYPFGLAMKDRQIYRDLYRNGYQGQSSEFDDETGWNHFELREFDAVVGRWTAVDPKRQYQSPYLAMGNNPVSSTDPRGGDDVYFNRDGSYSHTVDKSWFVDFFIGHRGYIEGEKGGFDLIYFHDEMDALNFGEGKKYQGITFLATDEVKSLVLKGIDDFKGKYPTPQSAFKFYKQLIDGSMGGQELDYSGAVSHGYLTVLGGRAYNDMDFGNFLWGLSLQRMEVPYPSVEMGSQFNAFWNAKLQNGEWKPTQSTWKRISWTGDSGADQNAIRNGYTWGIYNMGLQKFGFY
jgi:RHS repeat-associated protein